MRIKNTFNLLMANLRMVFSDMIFRVVFTAIIIGIGATFVVPLVNEIIVDPATKELLAAVQKMIVVFFNVSNEMANIADTLSLAWGNFISMLAGHVVQLSFVSIGLIVLFVIFAIFNGMANYASGVAIDSYMGSLTHVGYFHAISYNFAKGLGYQFLNAVINISWSVLLFVLSWFIFLFTAKDLAYLSLTVAVLVYMLGKSVSNTFLSCFMPAVVTEKMGVCNAFRKSFALGFKNFGLLYIQYFAISFVAMYINVSVAICTFGAGLLFSIPATCVCHSCLKLVNYYGFTKRKFYIDYDHIVVPVELRGEDEKFLTGIKI